jgi:spore coat protein U-like protein
MKLTQLFVALGIASIAVIGSDSRTHAATKTSDFNVTAKVVANCNITSTNVSFGDYDPLATSDLTSTSGSVTVTCTRGAAVTVDLNGGAQGSGADNYMASTTGGLLKYQLFQDTGHTVRWNNSAGTGGSSLSFTSSSLTPVVKTIYGVVPKAQEAGVADDYTDTVTATVNF